jgi:hypothetical protein
MLFQLDACSYPTIFTIYVTIALEMLRALYTGSAFKYFLPVWKELIADLPSAFAAQSTLENSIEKIIERGPESILITRDLAAQMREANVSRRKALEEKARGNLAALAISASFSTAGLTIAAVHPRIALLLLLPLLSFGLGAYASVKVLQVGRVFILTVKEEKRFDAASQTLWYTELNDMENSIKANWLYVSYKALRNAIILLVVSAAIAILAMLK